MIVVRKFDIFNYRSCIKTKIELTSSLTALIGMNGVGKSNILNSLQLLKVNPRNRYFNQKQFSKTMPHSRLTMALDIDSENYLLNADVYYDTDETNTDEIFSAQIKIKNISQKGRRWKNVDPVILDYVDFFTRSNRNMDIEKDFSTSRRLNDISKIAVRVIYYLNNISYYSATQFSDPTKCPISLELEDSRLIRSYRKSKTHEVFLYDLYRYFKSDKKMFDRYINTVNQNGIGLIDDIKFLDHNIPSSSYKVKAGGQIQKIEKTKNIIIPSIILDKLTLSPNQLSEGTFKTLALIFYILNDESDLLLIEEPEVCVHHGLLNSIVELIKIQSKRKQIIISTHSDFVLDQLKPENVVLVKKTKELGTRANSLPKSLSKNNFKALKEYLEESGNLGEYWKEGGFENG